MKLYECILSLFGGIAVFIAAMNMMSSNLQKLAGSKMKLLLTKKASNNLI
jgi:Na+/phosphate symporter